MYLAHYGLRNKPFALNPDPDSYFGSSQHRRARAYLDYGVHRNEGFIVITGEVGAGKTTLVRALLAGLNPGNVVAAHMVTTQLQAEDTLRLMGAAFGIAVRNLSKADLLMALEAWLVQQAACGRRCLLVVDEAQNLSASAIEELRMLSNFQYGQHALLQTYLVGQPEFRALLQSPAMQQLCQRVAASCHIGPMSAVETQGYIQHRLHCAGASDKPGFDEEAFHTIHVASGGIPRRINQLCDRLLLAGFLAGRHHFGSRDVEQVAAELQQEFSAPAPAEVPVQPALPDAPAPTGAAPAQVLQQRLQHLGADVLDARLRRLEGSMLRLEHLNLQLLLSLRQLAAALPQGALPAHAVPLPAAEPRRAGALPDGPATHTRHPGAAGTAPGEEGGI